MTISNLIKRTKIHLIAKAKKSGLYENFGDKEQHKIEDYALKNPAANNQKLILEFGNWCMDLSISNLK